MWNKGPLQRTNCRVCDSDSDVQNSHRPGGSDLEREVVLKYGMHPCMQFQLRRNHTIAWAGVTKDTCDQHDVRGSSWISGKSSSGPMGGLAFMYMFLD